MNYFYNALIAFINIFFNLLSHTSFVLDKKSKFSKFVMGQRFVFHKIEEVADTLSKAEKRIWIHAASLGEYGVARPIIKQLKSDGNCTVILTFFSSTGYEAIKESNTDADYVFYLPLDTKHNAKKFVEIISPHQAVFIISEYWPNYLNQLKKQNIPTYIISAIINKKSPFFKWYGKIFSNSLATFTHFFVLNKESQENLSKLGYDNSTLCGDPLFDNIQVVTKTPYKNNTIEKFIGNRSVFIAGSISDKNDVALTCALANKHIDTPFIFVPHEVTEGNLKILEENLVQPSIRYSESSSETDFTNIQTLIIDYVGELAYIYRYAKWAYVGGGFTQYLHSIIEATAYGIPVAFGPVIHRKITPMELVKEGLGYIVKNPQELDIWFTNLKNNSAELQKIRGKALEYANRNSGATSIVTNELKKNLSI